MPKIVILLLPMVIGSVAFSAPSNATRVESRTQVVASKLFESIDAGQVYELTFPMELRRSLIFDFEKPLSIGEVQVLSNEFVLGGRFAKMFSPRPTVYRRHLETTFAKLISLMKAHQVSNISLVELAELAAKWISEQQANRMIGDCYLIESQEEAMLPMARWVCLSWRAQVAIDSLFARSIRSDDLSLAEEGSIRTGKMQLNELAELRALRAATEIFENETYLKSDRAGGFINNFRGELLGGFQLNCWNRAVTYNSFIEKLSARKLIRFHRLTEMATKRPSIADDWSQGGHVASGIRNVRTGEQYVVETWYEKGGSPAHVLTYDDWFALPVTYWRSLNFNDVVELRR